MLNKYAKKNLEKLKGGGKRERWYCILIYQRNRAVYAPPPSYSSTWFYLLWDKILVLLHAKTLRDKLDWKKGLHVYKHKTNTYDMSKFEAKRIQNRGELLSAGLGTSFPTAKSGNTD